MVVEGLGDGRPEVDQHPPGIHPQRVVPGHLLMAVDVVHRLWATRVEHGIDRQPVGVVGDDHPFAGAGEAGPGVGRIEVARDCFEESFLAHLTQSVVPDPGDPLRGQLAQVGDTVPVAVGEVAAELFGDELHQIHHRLLAAPLGECRWNHHQHHHPEGEEQVALSSHDCDPPVSDTGEATSPSGGLLVLWRLLEDDVHAVPALATQVGDHVTLLRGDVRGQESDPMGAAGAFDAGDGVGERHKGKGIPRGGLRWGSARIVQPEADS